jgi:uncharacterized protein (TIGR02001 family)
MGGYVPRMIAADRYRQGRQFLLLVLILGAAPARAGIGGSLTLASQDRFRGYSVSDGRPAATLSLSYDDAGGAYFEASVMAAGAPSYGPRRYRFEENAGYALRIAGGPTVDAGIVHADYSGYYIYGKRVTFTEVYAGFLTKHLSAHLHYAPEYYQRGVSTFYADLDGSTELIPHIRLIAHYGVLFQIDGVREQAGRTMHDWRLGASADVGSLSFQLALSSGVKKRGFYGAPKHRGAALLFAANKAF